jgi:hypothetical protein
MTPAQGNKKASESLQPDQYLEPKWLRCSTSPLLCGVEKLIEFFNFFGRRRGPSGRNFQQQKSATFHKKKIHGSLPTFLFL